MATKRWTRHSYANGSEIFEGEIIITPFNFHKLGFKHGPNSHYTPSSHSHAFSSSSSRTRSKAYFLLVLNVVDKRPTKPIRLNVLPIVSYHSAPHGRTSPSDWNADRWMSETASDAKRLYHLPVPALNWTPSPFPDAPVLSFGSWKNIRPSWVAMELIRHPISEDTMWLRHPDGPVILDGGKDAIVGLYDYLALIPSMLEDINAAAIAQSTNVPIENTNPADDPVFNATAENLIGDATNNNHVISNIPDDPVTQSNNIPFDTAITTNSTEITTIIHS